MRSFAKTILMADKIKRPKLTLEDLKKLAKERKKAVKEGKIITK